MLTDQLKNVMTQGYLYVDEDQSAGKAIGIMRDMRISCVFVLQREMPAGIITEKNVIRAALRGIKPNTASVHEVMTAPLIALTPENTVEDARKLMIAKNIRHIAIVDELGFLKGTVTASNIVNQMGTESFSSVATVKEVMYTDILFQEEDVNLQHAAAAILETQSCCAIIMSEGYPVGLVSEKDIAHCVGYGQDLRSLNVRKAMSKPVIGVHEGDTITQAIITLRRHRIHRVVVYNDNGKISGILALSSLVRNLTEILR